MRAELGFLFFLLGVALPIWCWISWLPGQLLIVAVAAEVVAALLAVLSWRRPLAKITFAATVVYGVLAFWLGWDGLPTRPTKIRPTASWMSPLETSWVLQSPGKDYSIQTDATVKRNGEDSLRFELRAGERWIDQTFIPTSRAEVATKVFAPINSTQWYAFSVYFPTNFPKENQWLSFAQWKIAENLSEGLSRKGQRPVLRFAFQNGRFDVMEIHDTNGVVRDHEPAPEDQLFKKSNFHLGEWHDFVVQTKWSCREDGFINIWWNNRQIVEYHGPVGYQVNVGPQLKFGLYHDDTGKTYVAYFNHVKYGDKPQDVDFDPTTATHYSKE